MVNVVRHVVVFVSTQMAAAMIFHHLLKAPVAGMVEIRDAILAAGAPEAGRLSAQWVR